MSTGYRPGDITKSLLKKDKQWYEEPSLILQLRDLGALRDDLRDNNLFETEDVRPPVDLGEPTDEVKRARTVDGTWNDLTNPTMGAQNTGFGRNVPLNKTKPDRARLMDPNPREISEKLMARDTFKPAGIVNALAAAWLQFENHNWFFHGNGDPNEVYKIRVEDTNWGSDEMVIRKTTELAPSRTGQAPTYENVETHWWDGSQIYGSGQERQNEVRTFVDGKVKVDPNAACPPTTRSRALTSPAFRRTTGGAWPAAHGLRAGAQLRL